MATRVIMPTLGLTMEQGTIARWLKREGERVERDEPLFTVETDKATMDVPAPAGGVLARILVPEGATVPVLETIAIIAAPGEAIGEAGPAPAPRAAGARPGWPASPRARRVARELGVDLSQVVGTGPGGRIVEADVRAAAARTAPVEPVPASPRASPLAQRLARELGVDLSQVIGTGPGGRIRRADVEAAAHAAAAPASAPAAPGPVAPAAPAPAAARGGRLATLSRLRRLTAERMAQAARTVAPVTLFTEVDFAEAGRFRAQLLAEFERRYGARLTYDALIARACALALVEHPALNAHWTDAGPRLFDQVDIGVAVAVADGLTVPVVRDVAGRPLWAVARAVNDLVARTQAGRLGPDDFGGTFTITNLGPYGVESFTPIVNPPEVAILGVGAIRRQPVAAGDAVVVGERLTLSLTFDHRAVDGAPAAAFLARVREVLEKPYLLLT